jgi:hypothetical protein
MKQRRDKRGRFARNDPDWKLLTALFIFVMSVSLWGLIPIWIDDARIAGHSTGYSEGSNDAFLPAFEQGREFERNWTDCDTYYRSWLAVNGHHYICRKDQTAIALVDKNYKIVYEWGDLIPDNRMEMTGNGR